VAGAVQCALGDSTQCPIVVPVTVLKKFSQFGSDKKSSQPKCAATAVIAGPFSPLTTRLPALLRFQRGEE